MIVAENISKHYGAQVLFEGVSFRINPREKVGLVGRNGHGKTTLFRIIAGEEHPDGGKITAPKNYTLGYLRQHLDLSHDTVIAEASSALGHHEGARTWEAEKILSGLGFSTADMAKHPSELSGGYQVRLALVKVLLSEPNLLLLDEPNNYLDITSIRWLTRFLRAWPGEMMLVTHDRNFMDSIITHTLGIHRRDVRKVAGDTSKFYTQLATEEEIYEKTRINDEKRKKEIEIFVSRFRAKARLANMVQSRIKMLDKMGSRDRLEQIKDLEFEFSYSHTNAKYALTADSLSFSYGEGLPVLIKDLGISIGSHDRICVIGRNGRGKTTLLKLLAGVLRPTSGVINISQNTIAGYYEQSNVSTLVDTRTVLDEVAAYLPAADRQKARDICGAMLFEGDDALKKVAVLSGGEKNRVVLGKIIAQPTNLLLLDEPTNHLDMESCDALLAALDSYEGAVVVVTHNEMFLNALAERLIVFQNDSVSVFEGGYDRFLTKVGWSEEKEQSAAETPADQAAKPGSREMRKLRAEIITQRSKVLKPLEKRIHGAETEIDRLENELKKLHEGMIEASHGQDGVKIAALSQEIHRCEERIDELFGELSEVTSEYEMKKKEFESMSV
jgi:ATP-binding cassette subfamily F protein 3